MLNNEQLKSCRYGSEFFMHIYLFEDIDEIAKSYKLFFMILCEKTLSVGKFGFILFSAKSKHPNQNQRRDEHFYLFNYI